MARWVTNLLVGDRELLKVAKEDPETSSDWIGMFYSKGGVLSHRLVGNKTIRKKKNWITKALYFDIDFNS